MGRARSFGQQCNLDETMHLHYLLFELMEERMAVVEAEATLTERYQTTVPAVVRRALNLRKHDKLVYKVIDENTVVLERRESEEADPALGRFLDLLARDIAAGKSAVRPVTPELVNRINALVGDVDIDLEAPLASDDE
jgi:antitoxin PrlF